MKCSLGTPCAVFFCLSTLFAADDASPSISLTIPTGAPVREYLTKRVSKRVDAPVEAKLAEPLYAFDRQVVPAGVTVLGHVSHLKPVSTWRRASAIMNGDFTPLREAKVEF